MHNTQDVDGDTRLQLQTTVFWRLPAAGDPLDFPAEVPISRPSANASFAPGPATYDRARPLKAPCNGGVCVGLISSSPP
jgi:hypothetical protein